MLLCCWGFDRCPLQFASLLLSLEALRCQALSPKAMVHSDKEAKDWALVCHRTAYLNHPCTLLRQECSYKISKLFSCLISYSALAIKPLQVKTCFKSLLPFHGLQTGVLVLFHTAWRSPIH